MDPSVLFELSYGLYLVTVRNNGRPTGCVVNTVMQVTASPATVTVSVSHDNYTHDCMEKEGRFAVTILSEQSNPQLIGRFGFQSGRDIDKFEGVESITQAGLPAVADGCGLLVCRIIKQMDAGSHTLFLAEVEDAVKLQTAPPMTYAYYHNVIKGTSPKNAPTYRPEEKPKQPAQAKWVCSVCGYVYEGETPFEQLPDDYECPLCLAPKSEFVRQ